MKKLLILIGLFYCIRGFSQGGVPVNYPDTLTSLGGIIPISNEYVYNLENYNDDANALFARMSTQPTSTEKQLISDMIDSLQLYYIWDTLIAYWRLGLHTEQASKLNWIADTFNLTSFNLPTHIPYYGFIGNGSTSYLNTWFKPSTCYTDRFNNSSASFGVRTDSLNNTSGKYHGAYDGGKRAWLTTYQSGTAYASLFTNSAIGVSNNIKTGTFLINRQSTNHDYYINGVRNTGSQAANTPVAYDMYLLALNNAGTPGSHTSDLVNSAFIGGGFSDTTMPLKLQELENWFDSSFKALSSEEEFTMTSTQSGALDQVTIRYILPTGSYCWINFGDGQGDLPMTANDIDRNITSAYTVSDASYTITIKGQIDSLLKFRCAESTISGNFSEFSELTNLETLQLISTGTWSGNINNLPDDLKEIQLYELGSTLTGSTNNLPDNMLYISLINSGSFTGSLDNLPSTDTLFIYQGMPATYTGQLDNLPSGLKVLTLNSTDTTDVTGSLNNLPSGLTNCFIKNQSYGRITGDTIPQSLVELKLSGLNLGGYSNKIQLDFDDLPSGLEILMWEYSGLEFTGNLDSLPSGLTQLTLMWTGTGIEGVLDSVPSSLTILQIDSVGNSITGNIENLPSGLASYEPPSRLMQAPLMFIRSGTGLVYGSGTVPAWPNIEMNVQSGMTTANLDTFLNAWATTATEGDGIRYINFANYPPFGAAHSASNDERSSASDAAVTTLEGLNKTLYFNVDTSLVVTISADTITIPFDSIPQLIAVTSPEFESIDSGRWASYTLTGTFATPTDDTTMFTKSVADSAAGGGWARFTAYKYSESDVDSIFIELCDCGGAGVPSVLSDADSCRAWYIAEVGYITEDVGVTTWADATSNGNDLTQETDAAEPIFDGDSVYFDGTNDWMTTGEIVSFDQPCHIYAVINQHSYEQYAGIFSGYLTGFTLQQYENTPELRAYSGSASSSDDNAALNTWVLVHLIFDGANSSFQINDNTPITGDFGSNDADGVIFGELPSSEVYSEFSIKEYIQMKGRNSSANETAIINYLNNKYSLY